MENAYLILSNGMVFPGQRIGAPGESTGELVFNTAMVGYLETLSDPSYAGQIILQTFPLIGNYGVIDADLEGGSFARGYVVRELCQTPSNFRSSRALDQFLKERGICGICGVDTRAITRLIREQGVMNAKISATPQEDLEALRQYQVTGCVELVSCKGKTVYPAEGPTRYRVVLIDYGAKRNILRSLCRRGCQVTVVPYHTPADEILAMAPDGVVLSNGPGDPQENTGCIAQIRLLVGKVPLFGICLGHQLTALAMGGQTEKLKYGHRGANQPVRQVGGNRTFITSQNHGYAVVRESMAGIAQLSYCNANDGSCEGLVYPGKKCFTVQFHPEACPGPQDTAFLFDDFLKLMEREKHAKG